MTRLAACWACLKKPGLFTHPELQPERAENKPQHRRILREAAGEAIVLLKNNGTLPLKGVKSSRSSRAYAQPPRSWAAAVPRSHRITPSHPMKGSRTRAGDKIRVEAAPGCFIYKNLRLSAPRYCLPRDAADSALACSTEQNLLASPFMQRSQLVFNTAGSKTPFPKVNNEAAFLSAWKDSLLHRRVALHLALCQWVGKSLSR